ncbi:hypothetical protein [Nocardioides deserti]|uniref:Uncharacterized protein n=1 Tax=Nocardioides deserti TaxID=1588644 RepID=A0ABR6U4P2_9ACTN|nr:hypothetical protein [Nocardioides deserti]MBC2959406.1 hypothetical protein [Nocardioides deserti]GGO73422.1 hypothetical protein GCM10012276_18980 [Nocardioides deserti]
MSRTAPRRRADPPPRPERRPERRSERRPERRPRDEAGTAPRLRLPDPGGRTKVSIAWGVVVLALGALVAGIVPVGPGWLPGVGAVAVATTYTWALAARTGGRPQVFAALALLLGVLALALDDDALRTGAAVLTCVGSAVLGVMATVPARRFGEAARECGLALVIAAVGALATVGFEPRVAVVRFEYVTLGLALLAAFLLVHRLGAGLHGLGRRGLVAVLVGTALLAVTLAYAELLRRYGTAGLVTSLLDAVRWSRDTLGAFPRPIEAVLGVPALVWGCHMRARRRQGWWVCAFGVCATAPVANSLANPSISLLECALSVLYGAAVGLLLGYAVIRADLALTGPRGRRSRRAEEAAAGRPEPRRAEALL